MTRRDDPLDGLFGAAPPVSAARARPKSRQKPPRATTEAPAGSAIPEPPARAAKESATTPWHWSSGIDMPKTHRYPLELVDQLDDRTRHLNLPVGLTVAAALASFLELPDDELIAAVERAQQARKPRLRRR